MPLAFPGIVAAFFFFQFLTKSGLVSRVLFQAGIISNLDQFPDLINDTFGIGMITTHVFLAFPFFVLLFVNIIKTERVVEYQQLASTFAATKWQSLMRVSVPIVLQKALPNIILYFIFIFGAFEVPLLLGRSNPETISVLAVRKLQRFNLLDIPQGYAIAVLYTAFVFMLLVFLFKVKSKQ
jgi:putative spermidine/putrescine transport system permease protein